MDALCREIGGRGRADAVGATKTVARESALHAELRSTKMRDLVQQARDAGISERQVLDSQDADDPKAALVELLVDALGSGGGRAEDDFDEDALRTELTSLRMRDLAAKAKEWGVDQEALYDAQDGEQPKGDVVDLLLRSRRAASGGS